ncbi:MAG: GspE/PulE family protein [Candidatus Omnitrophica bacterium]|nr:GspE/PulE family protein [Candidatus Omnitrophota bacterium]MCM8831587.1 GspE/PulE family protein [Candidatus Omnitrophota bacterium]
MKADKFTNFLLEKKILTSSDLEKVIEAQKKEEVSLIELLIKEGYVTETEAVNLLCEYFSFVPIKIANINISKEVLELLPESVVKKYLVLPIGKIGSTLTVAMADPLNIILIDDLKRITNCHINPVIAPVSEIKEAIYKYYSKPSTQTIEDIIKDKTADLEVIQEAKEEISEQAILRSLEEAPVIKFTDYILKKAVEEKASDVLIEPLEKISRIRFRIDGILREIETFPKKNHPFIISRIKVMCNLNITECRLPQEGRFRKHFFNRDVDFRVSVLPSSLGEKAALRILDKSATILDIGLLGFEEDVLNKIKEDSLKPHGMILVCGPTGCGKTTTLYSILNYIYTPGKNIVTVEDPIEYQLRGINQVSINPAINLTFAKVLRSILRQDPNVIMVGEIRDAETADIAIKASLTGHLLLSTLHTTTSAGSVTRLINMGIEPFLLASTLIGVLSQRLVRKLCPKCKQVYNLSENIKEKYGINKDTVIYKAVGCSFCQDTGYKGRTLICEYLQVLPQIKSLINKSASEPAIKREARLLGMRTLREDGLLKISKGITTLEEVLKVSAPDEPL